MTHFIPLKLPTELSDNTYALGSALVSKRGFRAARYECFACGERWDIPRNKEGRLSRDFWKCPNGCNELFIEGIHSQNDAVKGLKLMAAYLAGYVERSATVSGVVVAAPEEALKDIIDEMDRESPEWLECIDALRYLLDHLIVDDFKLSHPHGPVAARHLFTLIASFFVGKLEERLLNNAA